MNDRVDYRKLSRRYFRLLTKVIRLDLILKRIQRVILIWKTDYRRLLFHEHLNVAKGAYKSPPTNIVHQDNEWTVLEIDKFRFFWPTQYRIIDRLGDIYHEVFSPVDSNPHAYEYGCTRINPGDWVIDAGACEGFFTHLALNRGANVLAIEPIPKLAEALSLTFETQISQGRVKVIQGALGAKEGEGKLTIPVGEEYNSTIEDSDGIPVKILSLDDIIFTEQIIPKLDFVKMDIEGGELDAIEGAKRILRQIGPKLSIAVYHEAQTAKTLMSVIKSTNPKYNVRWRGIFIREDFGPPRPYMLYAFR